MLSVPTGAEETFPLLEDRLTRVAQQPSWTCAFPPPVKGVTWGSFWSLTQPPRSLRSKWRPSPAPAAFFQAPFHLRVHPDSEVAVTCPGDFVTLLGRFPQTVRSSTGLKVRFCAMDSNPGPAAPQPCATCLTWDPEPLGLSLPQRTELTDRKLYSST